MPATVENLGLYEGPNLRALTFPLGGLGTGHFCMRGDGSFHQWQIFNQVNHQAYLPHTFLAIRTKRGREEPVVRLLQEGAKEDPLFEPAPSVSDHLIPDGNKELAEALPTIGSIRVEAVYPVANLRYSDSELPVEVSLEAFSPMIPLDEKNSGIPLAFLVFRITNPDEENSVQVALMASLQNAVGWDGLSPIHGTSNPLYGGNQNSLVRRDGSTTLVMTNPSLEEASSRSGEMALAVLRDDSTARVGWDDLKELWEDFASDGRLTPGLGGPTARGRTANGALAASLNLKPGQSQEIAFLIAWYFPNRYVNWDQRGLGVSDQKSMFWLGNRYATFWGGVHGVVDYGAENYQYLRQKTKTFRDCLSGTTIPWPVLDAASSQISTIRSPTCFWTEDGRFFGFEGCRGSSTGCSCDSGGCCPLNCTHVWNYEQALSRLYPTLERAMREVDLEHQMGPDGGIPHRTVLPLYLPRWRSDDKTSAVYAADGHCGTILKAYREYRACGDDEYLQGIWPKLRKALEFAVATWDPDRDGILGGPQWNTYDCHLHGQNTFVSGLYLAALRAMEEMATIRGEDELARECRDLFRSGSEGLDSGLWNGEYYVQSYDSSSVKSTQYGSGCHCDQLLGQWWAHLLELGHILPREHVRRALSSIYKHNVRKTMKGHKQAPRVYLKEDEGGMLICTWPKGGRPGSVTLYSDEVWTGTEYAVAGLMFFEDMIDEGLEIVRMARDRHDGRLRSPWNEVECGDHYVRPMSSWAMFESLCGYHYDAAHGVIKFGPRVKENPFTCFFASGNAWGRYAQSWDESKQVHRLTVLHGTLELQEIWVPILTQEGKLAKIYVDDEEMEAREVVSESGSIKVRLPVTLSEGGMLRIVSN